MYADAALVGGGGGGGGGHLTCRKRLVGEGSQVGSGEGCPEVSVMLITLALVSDL